eukprot:3496755-Amphidinium_carterae.1
MGVVLHKAPSSGCVTKCSVEHLLWLNSKYRKVNQPAVSVPLSRHPCTALCMGHGGRFRDHLYLSPEFPKPTTRANV